MLRLMVVSAFLLTVNGFGGFFDTLSGAIDSASKTLKLTTSTIKSFDNFKEALPDFSSNKNDAIPITMNELQQVNQDRESNGIVAAEKYDNLYVSIEGTVTAITKEKNEYIFTISVDETVNIICQRDSVSVSEKQSKDLVFTLNNGDYIKIFGRFIVPEETERLIEVQYSNVLIAS